MIRADRPHLPFHFPANFNKSFNIWEAYGALDDIALPLHESAPLGMPGIAFTYELDGMQRLCANGTCIPIPGPDIPGDNSSALRCPVCGPPPPPNITRILRKAYYSAVSFVDLCVGKMLARLDELGHADDTAIVFVGDHGYQLGEHNIWVTHRFHIYIHESSSSWIIRATTYTRCIARAGETHQLRARSSCAAAHSGSRPKSGGRQR
eukprot:COSAG01_NODE_2252_length_8074_cov_37.778809_6_plen_207_part_00